MKYLGIDYGKRKIGLAMSEGRLAEPLKVINVSGFDDAVQKVLQVIEVLQVEQVVVGVAENEIADEQKRFAKRFEAETFDETLTSQEAIYLSIQGGVKRKKRKEMEDAYAATIMLQNYLDNHGKM